MSRNQQQQQKTPNGIKKGGIYNTGSILTMSSVTKQIFLSILIYIYTPKEQARGNGGEEKPPWYNMRKKPWEEQHSSLICVTPPHSPHVLPKIRSPELK